MLRLGLIAAALMLADASCARAADTPLPIELNKLETLPAAAPTATAAPTAAAPAGGRGYFVINNNDADTLTQLRLDLVMFGTDGVIARRVALDLGPLPGKKTGVRLFDLTGQSCDGIGKVLINDVLECQSAPAGQPSQSATPAPATPPPISASACLDRLTPTSRIAAVTFGK